MNPLTRFAFVKTVILLVFLVPPKEGFSQTYWRYNLIPKEVIKKASFKLLTEASDKFPELGWSHVAYSSVKVSNSENPLTLLDTGLSNILSKTSDRFNLGYELHAKITTDLGEERTLHCHIFQEYEERTAEKPVTFYYITLFNCESYAGYGFWAGKFKRDLREVQSFQLGDTRILGEVHLDTKSRRFFSFGDYDAWFIPNLGELWNGQYPGTENKDDRRVRGDELWTEAHQGKADLKSGL